jgi:hypothetical protein
MPIPKPHKDEDKKDFMDRCMGDDVMNEEYPDNKQRYAICQKSWDEKDRSERQKYKVWSKEDAASWLKKNDFKSGNYEKQANYHSFRQEDPDKYDEFRIEKAPFGFKESDGVIAVYGIFEEDGKRKAEIQTIRFYHGEGDKEKKSNMQKMEFRSYPFEMRADGETKKIYGYSAVFNELSEDLGGFREKISPGAFRKTIKKDDIRALFNHDPNYVLGRNINGTLKLKEDEKGLKVEIEPPDTQWARDLLVSISRGDINQMSFGFLVEIEEWDNSDKKCPIRTQIETRLFDVSPVTFPAYLQTQVGVRTAQDVFNDFISESQVSKLIEDERKARTQERILRERERKIETLVLGG